MTSRTFIRALAVLAMLSYAVALSAADRSWYAGLGAGASRLNPDPGSNSALQLTDEQSVAASAWLGRDLSRRFSAELGLATLGEATLTGEQSIAYSAVSGGVIGYVLGNSNAIDQRSGLSAYLRGGLSVVEHRSDLLLEEADNMALWIGAGAEWPFSRHVALRAEVVSYDGDAQAAFIGLIGRQRATRNAPLIPRASKQQAPTATTETREAQSVRAPEPRNVPDAAPVATPEEVSEQAPERAPEQAPVIEPEVASTPTITAEPDTTESPATTELPAEESQPVEAEILIASAPDTSAPATCVTPALDEPADAQGCALFSGVIQDLEFQPRTAQITSAANGSLDRLAGKLAAHPDVVVEIQAHSEDLGDPQRAQALSRERAIAVARQLARAGIPVARLRARAFGASQPLGDNASANGLKVNNRVLLRVLP